MPWDQADEVTFECEPGTLQKHKLEALREMGVTRLSLGIENFDPRILEFNGRAHLEEEIYRAMGWAREVGFDGAPQRIRQRPGALDARRMPAEIETHQPLEVRQDGQRSPAAGRRDPPGDVAHALLIEHAVHEAQPIQLPRRSPRPPVRLHTRPPGRYITS